MKHSHWLLLYDICDPKRLRSVEKIVSQYGVRIQKSVFEINSDYSIITVLQKKLEAVTVAEDGDCVAFIPLCEHDWQKSERYGIESSHDFVSGDFEIL